MNLAAPQQRPLIEACVSSVADAFAAVAAGADRLEICSALEVGGLTPSVGLLELVLAEVSVPVVAMVRPRLGGFCYDEHEFRTALRDAARALEAGAVGVVFGFLTKDGTIDVARCQIMVDLAGGRDAVFHRAFDFVREPLAAADQLAELGIRRLLTSGQRPSALEGASLIRAIADRTRGHLGVMPGGGIHAENAVEIVKMTSCNQLHIGASTTKDDGSLAGNSLLDLVPPQQLAGGAFRKVDAEKISQLMQCWQRDEPDPAR